MEEPYDDPETALALSARLGARWRVGLGAALILLILGVAVAVVAGLLTPGGEVRPVAGPTSRQRAAVTPAAESTPSARARVFVHVLGQIARPGVYELSDGARVLDAISAAGGFAPSADRAGLNLARPLVDGEQIIVPRPGEVVAQPGPAAGVAGGGAGAARGSEAGPAPTVDLNSASLEQLETLPRVGPALAQRIIDWRTENHRFSSVDDLKNVSGIGDKLFAGIAPRVVVR